MSVAWTRTLPSTTFGGMPGATDAEAVATPSTFIAVSTTLADWSAGVRICTGVPAPASKCLASSSWPVTDSTLSRNSSSWEMPEALNVGRNAPQISSASALSAHTLRGLRPTSPETRPHSLRPPTWSRACTWSTRGIDGQKIRRPKASSSAGRKVIAEISAPAMPMAPTGPRPLVLPSSDSSRQSRPRMTVAALAAIGSIEARQATFIASNLLSKSCSSSLYRETSSSE